MKPNLKKIMALLLLSLNGCTSFQYDMGMIDSVDYYGAQCVKIGHAEQSPAWQDCIMQMRATRVQSTGTRDNGFNSQMAEQNTQMQRHQDNWNQRMHDRGNR